MNPDFGFENNELVFFCELFIQNNYTFLEYNDILNMLFIDFTTRNTNFNVTRTLFKATNKIKKIQQNCNNV